MMDSKSLSNLMVVRHINQQDAFFYFDLFNLHTLFIPSKKESSNVYLYTHLYMYILDCYVYSVYSDFLLV